MPKDVRMLKINYVTSLDKNEKENYNWTPVLQIFTSLDDHEIDKIKDNSQAALRYIITDKTNTNSIRSIITKAREMRVVSRSYYKRSLGKY
ncbi:MAG: alpha-E domain-containing protein [Saprospirales bacterium]|nr:alpha-E domain-containing protein [Saprospirales bacterium]